MCSSSCKRFWKPSWVSWWGAQSRALPTWQFWISSAWEHYCGSGGQGTSSPTNRTSVTARDRRSGKAVEFALGTLDQGLLTPSHTGLFLICHTWVKVQSKNVWGCSFPSASPPCITLRYKLTRTSLKLLAPTDTSGSAHYTVVLLGPSQPHITGLP